MDILLLTLAATATTFATGLGVFPVFLMVASSERFTSPLPSAFITKMSASVGPPRVKAMCAPSGDQLGK